MQHWTGSVWLCDGRGTPRVRLRDLMLENVTSAAPPLYLRGAAPLPSSVTQQPAPVVVWVIGADRVWALGCIWCGRLYARASARIGRQRTCSGTCRTALYLWRHRQGGRGGTGRSGARGGGAGPRWQDEQK